MARPRLRMTAVGNLYTTLRSIYPRRGGNALWHMIGVAEDIGRDDFGPCETFTTDDATTIARWAIALHLAEVSFWNIQRDHTARSHVPQGDWQISHMLEPVTQGRGHRS